MASIKKEKIQYAIRQNPTLIPILLNDNSINNGMIYRMLKETLPCRIGIEFELSGSFVKGFNKKYNPKLADNQSIEKYMTNFYGVYEIKSDCILDNSPEAIIEIRVSIKDYHQLSGLYKFMQDLPEFCKLHQHGGIHIHLDMSEFENERYAYKRLEVCHYIQHRLSEIHSIFPKYTGKYNKRRVGNASKASWVNYSRLNTLEVRIAPLTFDYKTLMDWIIKLTKFRRKLIYECRLTSKPKFSPTSLSKKSMVSQGDEALSLQADNTSTIVVRNVEEWSDVQINVPTYTYSGSTISSGTSSVISF